MKIRNGFVSNSSASSFCIYGWKVRQINYNNDGDCIVHQKRIMEMLECLEKEFKSKSYNILTHYVDDYEDLILGIGSYKTEFDHDMDPELDGWWYDYESPSPNKKDCDKLDALRKEFEEKFSDMLLLDSFKIYEATYWA